jgi:flagellar basal body rod protein FlgC
MDMYVNATALDAFGSGMQATAHNIANVSTRDFEPQTYAYMSGPDDYGVIFVPKEGFDPPPPSYPDPSLGYWADSARPVTSGDVVASSIGSPKAGFDPPPGPPYYPDPTLGYWTDTINNSVDTPREIVNMIANERAYQVNVHVISTMEDTSGVLLDMIV